MFPRVRALLLKTPVLIAVGLVAFYFLFAWFAFEPLAKWAATKIVADKSRHSLTLDEARFDPLALSLRVKGLKLAEPDGKPLLAFGELFVDFEAASLFKWAYTFQEVSLKSAHAHVALLSNGQLNWTALIEAFKSEEEEPDKPLPRLLVQHFHLEKGRVDLADQKVGFATSFNPLDLTLDDLSTLPDDKGAYAVAATTKMGERIRWKGDLSLTPTVATGQLGIEQIRLTRFWPYLQHKLNMAPPEGVAALALNYRVAWIDKKLSLVVDKLGLNLEQLALRGKLAQAPAVRLDKLTLSDGHFDLDKRSLDIGAIALQGGQVNLNRDPAGRLDLQELFAAPPSAQVQGTSPGPVPDKQREAQAHPPAKPSPGQAPQGEAPWRINLAAFSLDGLGVRFTDLGFLAPMSWDVGKVRVGFSLATEVGAGPPQVRVRDLGVEFSEVRTLVQGNPKPLAVMGALALEGGSLDLAAREFLAQRLALLDGQLEVVRDRQGQIGLIQAFRRIPSKTTAAAVREEVAEAATAWKYRFDTIALEGFGVQVRDEGVQPAARLTLEPIDASMQGLNDNLNQPLPVKLSLRVKEGGAFQAEGKFIPGKAAADLRLKLSNLSLKPVQPFVSQAAHLTLASGTASASGRLKYDGKPSFDGGFQVADLLINESEGGERFLAWKRLETDSLSYRPEALSIDELKLDGLGAKLVIDKDKTVNLKKILKAQVPPSTAAAPATTGSAPAAPVAKKEAPATRMTIDRIRVENGELDFADLSLALPFGTRIHHFKGAFNGISTQPGTTAQLELDGQVDDYGLARAVGQLDLFDPTAFMDIKVVFRNVEMTNLTPYTATFVGRKIQSGKLSLDLEYKIKQRQLLGENQIIMDKLTLGERVESPTAKDLPLDLAIAILQDTDGRIDLGLPVSGSLDDPQFSYGRIIWKAIGNILTKIVTAPFRALASLFGGNGEKLEKVAFEAGEADLTPPEKEKLKQISTILNKRPGLALTVHPAWSAEVDRPVLKEARLRRAIGERMGLKLRSDEDPGPISTANPKAQAALEALYASRFGEEAWKTLQAKWIKANPEKKQEGGAGKLVSRLKGLIKKEEPLSEADLSALKGTDLHALLYAQMLAKEAVTDADLSELARKRGETLVAGLTVAGAPAARVKTGEVESSTQEGREVPARMELGVAK